MTPIQCLEEAKSRFIVLYHDDPATLNRLLRQALLKMQEKAGVIAEMWTSETMFSVPARCHAIAGCCDSARRFVPWRFDPENCAVSLRIYPKHEPPYCLEYFLEISKWPDDEELPGKIDALLCDYLEALIAVPNMQRQREAYLMTGMQTAVQELPTISELKQRVAELELAMEDNKALIPPHSYF